MKIISEIRELAFKLEKQFRLLKFETLDEPSLRLKMAERYLNHLLKKIKDSQRIFSEIPRCEKCGKKL